jgi:hypothetical protein
MGVWGTSLYSSDVALDLRSTIAAIARLPFDGDRLLDILIETNDEVANNLADEDYTTFWLVVADQFAKRGIICDRASGRALAMIDGGDDLAMCGQLGMQPADLSKRQKSLLDLRARLISLQAPVKPRSVLKKPQPFLMAVGDVLVYPTYLGQPVNPYFASKEADQTVSASGWQQDGWSAFVVVDRGREFGFLAWYRPLTTAAATIEKPTLSALRGQLLWKLQRPGTCSPVHFKRMELENIGTLTLDIDKLKRTFPIMPPGTFEAIDGVSLANSLSATDSALPVRFGDQVPTIPGLDRIL